MKTIKQTVLILLVLLVVANTVSYFYLDASDREVPPEIICPGEILEVSASDSEAVLLSGVTARDEQDGDLTHRVAVAGVSKLTSKDTAKVTYIVFDSDNNMATCVRRIRYVDYSKPVFGVIEPLVYSSTEDVSLLSRLQANDVVDGDISKNIRVSTLEPTSNSEVFLVSMQVTNSVGDTSIVALPVLVQESNPLRPEIQLSDSLVYVDLDDNFTPSAYLLGVRAPGMGEVPLKDITVDNTVDTGKSGTYYVTYTYSANGSTGTAILTVVVE